MSLFSEISDTVSLMFRRPKHWQYGALCYRRNEKTGDTEILLMTSRDTGRWVIPKGWPMGEKPGHEVAAQEALEEAGLTGRASAEPIGKFDYRKCLTSGLVVPCEVRVYGMLVTGCVENYKEKGQRIYEWVSPSEAARRVQEPGLARLIHSFDLQVQLAG